MQMIRGDITAEVQRVLPTGVSERKQDWGSALTTHAVARIWKPSKSAMTSGPARSRMWKMSFPRQSAPWLEPLMGWMAGDGTLHLVEMNFPTLDAAVRHAERLGVPYEVQLPSGEAERRRRDRRAQQTAQFSDATLERLGLTRHRAAYRRAMAGAADRADATGGTDARSPMDIVCDPLLGQDAKRSILMNWAYGEYLEDLASIEGMPENGRRSRLEEIERALFALETGKLARALAS